MLFFIFTRSFITNSPYSRQTTTHLIILHVSRYDQTPPSNKVFESYVLGRYLHALHSSRLAPPLTRTFITAISESVVQIAKQRGRFKFLYFLVLLLRIPEFHFLLSQWALSIGGSNLGSRKVRVPFVADSIVIPINLSSAYE